MCCCGSKRTQTRELIGICCCCWENVSLKLLQCGSCYCFAGVGLGMDYKEG